MSVPLLVSYRSKQELLTRFAHGKRVLHLGAVGCTLQSIEEKIAAAPSSVHAHLTRISTCVGVDIDAEGVRALSDAGVFDNLIAGDAQVLSREEIPLHTIDVIVAGDLIEHLSNPGTMLDSLYELSNPSTVLVLTTPNAMGLPGFLRNLMGRSDESRDHVMSFSRFTLSNLLGRHGWTIREMHSCYQSMARQRYPRWLFSLGEQMFRRLPNLGGTLFTVARRSLREPPHG